MELFKEILNIRKERILLAGSLIVCKNCGQHMLMLTKDVYIFNQIDFSLFYDLQNKKMVDLTEEAKCLKCNSFNIKIIRKE